MSEDLDQDYESELPENPPEPWIPDQALYARLGLVMQGILLFAGMNAAHAGMSLMQPPPAPNALPPITVADGLFWASLIPFGVIMLTFAQIGSQLELGTLRKGSLGLFGLFGVQVLFSLASMNEVADFATPIRVAAGLWLLYLAFMPFSGVGGKLGGVGVALVILLKLGGKVFLLAAGALGSNAIIILVCLLLVMYVGYPLAHALGLIRNRATLGSTAAMLGIVELGCLLLFLVLLAWFGADCYRAYDLNPQIKMDDLHEESQRFDRNLTAALGGGVLVWAAMAALWVAELRSRYADYIATNGTDDV